MPQIIHKRFTSSTFAFHEELIKLGFKEQDPEGHGLNQIRKFKKGDKIVHSSYEGLILFDRGIKLPPAYQGLTVHDEMLKFFATRNPIKVNPDE